MTQQMHAATEEPETLYYACPACDEAVEVPVDLVGRALACPGCHQPIVLEVEHAHPIDRPAPGQHVTRLASDAASIEESGLERDLDVRHPSWFRGHPFLRSLEIVGVVGLAYAASVAWGDDAPVLAWIATGVGALLALHLVYLWVQTRFTRLRVTNRRSIHRKGIVSRETSEVRHEDVRNLRLDQNAFERIFGIGTLAISSAGQDDLEIVARNIPHPEEVVEMIRTNQRDA